MNNLPYLSQVEKGAKFLGSKLIVLDAGVRAGEVHLDYLAGRNWQRRAAVETAGFGFGVAAGIAAGQATVGYLSIALLATPLGWVFIIGAALTVGCVAAKGGDLFGKSLASGAYDLSSWISSF